MLTRVIQNIVQNILRYAESKAVIRYRNEEDDLFLSLKMTLNQIVKWL